MSLSSARIVALGFAGALLIPRVASAADLPDERDHALPCRPTIACTADIVPAGTFEVEAGVLLRRLRRSQKRERQWTFPFLLKQSFTDWFQLQIGSNGYSLLDHANGAGGNAFFDDVIVGPKVHLVDQQKWVPAFSLSGELSLPTFHENGYLRTYDALFTGYVTKDFGWLHADLNLGFNLWRLEERPKAQELVALALQTNLIPPLSAMLEGYVATAADPITSRDGGVLFALAETPVPWLVLDEGGDVGFYPSTRAFSVFIGMTFIPAVFWRKSDLATAGNTKAAQRSLSRCAICAAW